VSFLYAQGSDIEWIKSFGGVESDFGWDVYENTDGGFILTGKLANEIWLTRTDNLGDTLWTRTYGTGEGHSVQQTADSGFILLGAVSGNILLIKTNSQGDTVWTRLFDDDETQTGHSIQETSDAGFIVAGQRSESGQFNVLLLKTDNLGNLNWEKTFGGASGDIGQSVRETTEGGYIITGYKNNLNDVWLIKTNSLGDTTWTRTFGPEAGFAVRQTVDDGFIITGHNSTNGRDILLIKTDSIGVQEWVKTYGSIGADIGRSVEQTFDEGYIIAGQTDSFGAGIDGWIVRTDKIGKELWTKTYGFNDNDFATSVKQVSDGGYIVTGQVNQNIFLMKIGPEPVPMITNLSPSQNELNVLKSTEISVTFDVAMDASSFDSTSFYVYASQSGFHGGTYTYDIGSKTITFDPSSDFYPGETVSVTLTTAVTSSLDQPLPSGYSYSFIIESIGGSGVFADHVQYILSNRPIDIVSADFDLDNDVDLAVTYSFSNTDSVSILLNNGDGTFKSPQSYDIIASAGGFKYLDAGDIDLDGDIDIVIINSLAETVSVLLNNGDGTFATQSTYSVGVDPISIISSDIDGDGDFDLVTANFGEDSISVLLNNGDGTFATQSTYSVGVDPISIISSDIDGDGDFDLVTANFGFSSVK